VQNKPNFEKRRNESNRCCHNGLRKNKAFGHPKSKPKANPNKAKAKPISGPSGPPKAKANPSKPKQTQFAALCLALQSAFLAVLWAWGATI
jgi:hypothetical protein